MTEIWNEGGGAFALLTPIWANLNFSPTFKALRPDCALMDEQLDEMLREAGEELRASHDDAVIADVIGEVEASDADSAEETGEILRKMVGFEE